MCVYALHWPTVLKCITVIVLSRILLKNYEVIVSRNVISSLLTENPIRFLWANQSPGNYNFKKAFSKTTMGKCVLRYTLFSWAPCFNSCYAPLRVLIDQVLRTIVLWYFLLQFPFYFHCMIQHNQDVINLHHTLVFPTATILYFVWFLPPIMFSPCQEL